MEPLEINADVHSLLGALTAREAEIIAARFGLDGPKLVLRELGREMGISGDRVRQIEQRAIRKMRAKPRRAK
jgi:RNA polymerase primary sigma factor